MADFSDEDHHQFAFESSPESESDGPLSVNPGVDVGLPDLLIEEPFFCPTEWKKLMRQAKEDFVNLRHMNKYQDQDAFFRQGYFRWIKSRMREHDWDWKNTLAVNILGTVTVQCQNEAAIELPSLTSFCSSVEPLSKSSFFQKNRWEQLYKFTDVQPVLQLSSSAFNETLTMPDDSDEESAPAPFDALLVEQAHFVCSAAIHNAGLLPNETNNRLASWLLQHGIANKLDDGRMVLSRDAISYGVRASSAVLERSLRSAELKSSLETQSDLSQSGWIFVDSLQEASVRHRKCLRENPKFYFTLITNFADMLEEREQSGYFHHKQSAEYYKTIELALVVHPDMLVTVPTYKPARYYTQLQNFLQDEPGVEDPREFFEGAKQTAKRRRRATSNQVRTTQRLSAAAAEPSQLVDLLSDSSELSDKGAPDFSSDAAFHNRMETDAEEQEISEEVDQVIQTPMAVRNLAVGNRWRMNLSNLFRKAKVFIQALQERYDWKDEDYEAEWEAAKSNPNAVWANDSYNEPVCSLLTITAASSSRELSHSKIVGKSRSVEEEDLADAFNSVNHFQQMPALPGLNAPLAICAPKGKAKAKPRAKKGKGKGKGQMGEENEHPEDDGKRKRVRDEELFQLDLKRDENEPDAQALPSPQGGVDEPIGTVMPPPSMDNIDLEEFQLLRNILWGLHQAADPSQTAIFGDAMIHGLPSDASKPTTCGYLQQSLPSPCLGNLPRDNIFQELRDDMLKEVKQRRDLGLPSAEIVP
ncbi:unnamed protein product [Durusdinium trenchii]|uniref:Uncharacterized protein n=1 Tax=Durusdinium trenchii TaxID=1381693 RepID=A0ABP0S3C2_9DINO